MSIANLEHPNNNNLYCGSLTTTNLNTININCTNSNALRYNNVYNNVIVPSVATVWQKGIGVEYFSVVPDVLSDVSVINVGYVGSRNIHGFGVGSVYLVTMSYTCVPSNGSSPIEVQFNLGATPIRRTIGTIDTSDCNGRFTFEFSVISYNPTTGAYAIVWTWSNAFAKGTTIVNSSFEIGGSGFSSNITGIDHIMPFSIGVKFTGSSDDITFGRVMCLVRQLA